MNTSIAQPSLRLIARLLCVCGGAAAFAGPALADLPDPKLEIFANQLPILIGRGQPKTLTLTGAVYDGDIVFDGKVFIRPKVSTAVSCPIFRNGDNFGVAVTRNTTNVPFRLEVLTPQNHPTGEFTCTLTYSGTQFIPTLGRTVAIATIGNDVQFQYRVKNKFVP
ncbi:hypothetical protein [Janthinobacterium fluminis]|uniref:DUF4402 domain-containing protein n=1 Tax=Janthinobacterium fluminis TaxID=2987524 RepID=A0ABT5K2R1_9BURK|nr:hypothetical protein [Janthinobacterium fluminis]MDC8759260.1 hypothetical protein [Janthinobacterium fluminis]